MAEKSAIDMIYLVEKERLLDFKIKLKIQDL